MEVKTSRCLHGPYDITLTIHSTGSALDLNRWWIRTLIAGFLIASPHNQFSPFSIPAMLRISQGLQLRRADSLRPHAVNWRLDSRAVACWDPFQVPTSEAVICSVITRLGFWTAFISSFVIRVSLNSPGFLMLLTDGPARWKTWPWYLKCFSGITQLLKLVMFTLRPRSALERPVICESWLNRKVLIQWCKRSFHVRYRDWKTFIKII
jgi:hypothetical protein